MQDRVFQRLLEQSGIEAFNSPQGNILYVLWQQDGIPISQIARKTGLAKTTLTPMLTRMEEGKLISRQSSAEDRRQQLIFLTPQAREMEAKYEEVSQEMNSLFYRGLSQKDATLIDGLLEQILENLETCENAMKHKTEGK